MSPSSLLFSFENQDVASRFIDGAIAIPNMKGVTIKIKDDASTSTPQISGTETDKDAINLICELGAAMDKKADIPLWAYRNQARIRTICLTHQNII